MIFKLIFQKLKNEKMQVPFFKKLIFWILLSIHGLKYISLSVLYETGKQMRALKVYSKNLF